MSGARAPVSTLTTPAAPFTKLSELPSLNIKPYLVYTSPELLVKVELSVAPVWVWLLIVGVDMLLFPRVVNEAIDDAAVPVELVAAASTVY